MQWGDASRLLSFYQEWLDDLFPKAKFLDALAMVEKAGHNKKLQIERVTLINQGKPKTSVVADGEEATERDQQDDGATHRQAERVAPIFEKTVASRPRTPELDDLFGGEDDIYNATPTGARGNVDTTKTGGEPDDDELDALMAEEEANPKKSTEAGSGSYQSIFGSRKPAPAAAATSTSAGADEDDDLDALMAEAEAEQASRQKPATAPGNGDKEATPKPAGADAGDDEDDLDALMAEAEVQSTSVKKPSRPETSAAGQVASEFNDEEAAMAEMEGLW